MAAPLLKSFSIDCYPYGHLKGLGMSWFAGHAPMLQRCAFFEEVSAAPAFVRARTMMMSIWRPIRSLDHFHHLENLLLRTDDKPFQAAIPLAIPSHVRRLWILSEENVIDVIQSIDHSEIQQISVDYNERQFLATADGLAKTFAVLSPSPTAHLAFYAPDRPASLAPTFHLQAHDAIERCRTYANVVQGSRGVPLPQMPSVSIYGLHLFRHQLLSDMTSLSRLEILCAVAADHFARLEGPGLDCPSLEHLTVTVPWDAQVPLPYAMRARDVSFFLQCSLGRSPAQSKLALTIRGAQLEGDALELRELVSDVVVLEAAWQTGRWWKTACEAAWLMV